MLRRRSFQVDNADPRARLERGCKVVNEGIGLGDLVIHVHQDRGIERRSGQAGVVWFAEREDDILQSQPLGSLCELDEIVPRDVLRDDGAGGTDER